MNGFAAKWLAVVGVLVISGCASSASTRFFLLAPLESAATQSEIRVLGQRPSLGVGPVSVPQYLDRPQIVTRSDRNNVALGEFEQWSEPLANNIARVLMVNLSLLTGSDEVVLFPWRLKTVPYQIPVRVLRFDGKLGGECTLVAAWRIIETKNDQTLLSRTSRLQSQAAGGGYDAMVVAMNEALAVLSREIAAGISEIE
jgi:uncharacterized lipoprotein YmbA